MTPTHLKSPFSGTSEEPRWFAYADERRVGPFSTSDIQAKLIEETLRPSDLVWSKGMADWNPISEIELFHPDAPVLAAIPNEANIPSSRTFARKFVFTTPDPIIPNRKKESRIRVALFFAGLIILAATAYFAIPRRGPSLTYIPDISTAEAKEFERIASVPFESQGPNATIALAQSNPAAPSIYVGTNAPSETRFILKLESVDGTLLSLVPVLITQNLTIQKHVARSQSIQKQNGKPLAAGSYRVSVLDTQGRKIAEKVLFLGGISGTAYAEALGRIQKALPKQKSGELIELRQITATLEDQLTQTTRKFSNPNGWPSFSKQWKAFENQLSQELRPLPNEEEEVFHSGLFVQARNLFEQINRIHEKQTLSIKAPARRTALELEVAEETSATQSGILALQGEITLAEKKAVATKK